MEIFLETIGTAKRAPTFQINVAVTNFAPERIVSDKRGSAADKCIRIETYTGIADNCGIEGEKPSPQVTSKEDREWLSVWKPDARRVYVQPVQQRAVVTHRR